MISMTVWKVQMWCTRKHGLPRLFSRHLIGQSDPKKTQQIFDQHKDWICTKETMETAAKNAIYLHCLPADRGFEVTNEVIDKTSGSGWTSAAVR